MTCLKNFWIKSCKSYQLRWLFKYFNWSNFTIKAYNGKISRPWQGKHILRHLSSQLFDFAVEILANGTKCLYLLQQKLYRGTDTILTSLHTNGVFRGLQYPLCVHGTESSS